MQGSWLTNMSPTLFRGLVLALAVAASGCGLIDSDITDFDLSVPSKTFTIDTTQWGLTDVDAFLGTSCAGQEGVCAGAAQQACSGGQCFGSCNAESKTCDLKVVVGLSSMVNLFTEKPELQTINDQPLVDVTIDSISYTVSENSLNVATPPMTLYVAPATVLAPGDAAAEPIGVIDPVPAATTLPETDVTLSAEGRATLTRYMTDYKTPFNILLGSQLDVHDGDPVPQGKLSAAVHVAAHAGI